VAAFSPHEPALDPAPLEVARESLERTGLFLVGESHGIAETANAVLALVRRLGIRALALEWSHDEVEAAVQDVFETGRIDLDALWEVPPEGDLFARDGRFTAGHVAVIERLVATEELEQLILFDRLDSAAAGEREHDLASRLLRHLRTGLPTLAVAGAAHASREPVFEAESMALRLSRALPGLATGALSFSTGTCSFRGEHPVAPIALRFDALFHLGHATPAVVPAK
jgi:erythromycin esterase-like protein